MAKDEIDPEELELEEDDALEEDEIGFDDDIDDDGEIADDDIDDDESMGATIVRKAGDEDEDEDDMVAPDDVEEDLAEILKDRMAAEEVPAEEDEIVEVDERGSGDDALQPKRADEVLCNQCFMLVRQNAPTCPMGDDECPIVVKKKSKK